MKSIILTLDKKTPIWVIKGVTTQNGHMREWNVGASTSYEDIETVACRLNKQLANIGIHNNIWKVTRSPVPLNFEDRWAADNHTCFGIRYDIVSIDRI